MKIGAQMYTIRGFCKTSEDIVKSLERLAKMGVDCIHFSGCGPIDPVLLRETCERLGIEIVLTHVPFDRLINETDQVIKEHKLMGCNCIGLGAVPKEMRNSPEDIEAFLDMIKEPITKIRAAGMRFNYHNHAYEFNRFNGKPIMEQILERYSAEEMGITLDTYWVHQSGADLYPWIEKMPGRLAYTHIKDQILEEDGKTAKMAPIGDGHMNFPGIMAALEKAGTEYVFIEQDYCYERDPFECLERSFAYLKSIGY